MSDFQVRNAEIERLLKDIGRTIAGALPDGYGFTLLLFDFGPGGAMFYLSNSQREDMIRALEEFIEKQRPI